MERSCRLDGRIDQRAVSTVYTRRGSRVDTLHVGVGFASLTPPHDTCEGGETWGSPFFILKPTPPSLQHVPKYLQTSIQTCPYRDPGSPISCSS